MSKLQAVGEYVKFKSMNIYPVVEPLDTIGWEFGGHAKGMSTKVYPICHADIDDLKSGKYDGHKYVIRDCPVGAVLVKHPFRPYELIPSDTSEYSIITDHLNDLAKIFKALGAKSCKATAKVVKKETVRIKLSGKMKIKTVKIRGDFDETSDKSKESEYKLIITRDPDANNGFEYAYKIAEEDGLLEVREIKNILDQFKIQGKDKTYQLSEVLTEDYHKTIDGIVELNASRAFKFDGKLNYDIKCRRKICIDQKIGFE